jgi:hypothetical protein
MLTFATPQAVLLLLLELFRVRAHVLFGAAIALAAQLVLALLMTTLFAPAGQWWCAYALTLPGAFLGTLALPYYDNRVRYAGAVRDSLTAGGLILAADATRIFGTWHPAASVPARSSRLRETC